MVDQVEPRREFIQKHALDVRNLDVETGILLDLGEPCVVISPQRSYVT